MFTSKLIARLERFPKHIRKLCTEGSKYLGHPSNILPGISRSFITVFDKSNNIKSMHVVGYLNRYPRHGGRALFSSPTVPLSQAVERDDSCTGYVCDRRAVGECICSNDRAKRDRERHKLSADEIKVESFYLAWHKSEI